MLTDWLAFCLNDRLAIVGWLLGWLVSWLTDLLGLTKRLILRGAEVSTGRLCYLIYFTYDSSYEAGNRYPERNMVQRTIVNKNAQKDIQQTKGMVGNGWFWLVFDQFNQ